MQSITVIAEMQRSILYLCLSKNYLILTVITSVHDSGTCLGAFILYCYQYLMLLCLEI